MQMIRLRNCTREYLQHKQKRYRTAHHSTTIHYFISLAPLLKILLQTISCATLQYSAWSINYIETYRIEPPNYACLFYACTQLFNISLLHCVNFSAIEFQFLSLFALLSALLVSNNAQDSREEFCV